MLIAFNKPYGVLSQFTSAGSSQRTLRHFHFPPRVYPLGRLDADSEGLLLLSDEPGLNSRLLEPERRHPRTYWVQVEGLPSQEALAQLRRGVVIQGRRTLPCEVWPMPSSHTIPQRNPPIRTRHHIPTSWLSMRLDEGKNRQVRRMTAAVGHPTLRLIRAAIGEYQLGELPAGDWKALDEHERSLVMKVK